MQGQVKHKYRCCSLKHWLMKQEHYQYIRSNLYTNFKFLLQKELYTTNKEVLEYLHEASKWITVA